MEQGGDWESIVLLARKLDGAVAAGMGVDAETALRLARALVAFDRRVADSKLLVRPSAGSPSEAIADKGTDDQS
jgi:hypothetical protein